VRRDDINDDDYRGHWLDGYGDESWEARRGNTAWVIPTLDRETSWFSTSANPQVTPRAIAVPVRTKATRYSLDPDQMVTLDMLRQIVKDTRGQRGDAEIFFTKPAKSEGLRAIVIREHV
jgi:hypothetical protein